MDDLLQEFIAETRDMLGALSTELVLWETDPRDKERLDSVFRFVHTVKGSCGFLNLPRFERLSHTAEDILSDLRDGKSEPSPSIVNGVLAVIDRIGALIEAIDAGDSLPEAGDIEVINALNKLADDGMAPAHESPAQPTQIATADSIPVKTTTAMRSIRVPLELIDRLMHGVSDMVLARNEVGRCLREQMNDPATENAFERLSACIAEMRDAIGQTRMQRIERIFSPLPRLVRDLCGELAKQVTLVTEGSNVELDREMIEMIRDPLTHVIRNAVDHGIEKPEIRRALGKPEAGRLSISARQSGNQILIEVSDDGRGISLDRLAEKAIAARLKTHDEIQSMSQQALLELIFAPGLSTADHISAISGRGVGMDVVRANIELIGGSIDLENREGHGLKVTLRVPLTLTIIPCLTVRAGGQDFALPRSAIREILYAGNEQLSVRSIGGACVAYIRGECLPFIGLEDLLGVEVHQPGEFTPRTIVSINAASDYCYALAVEAVLDHEELVVRPGSPVVMASGLFAGTTLPDNGRPMLLLDPLGLALRAGIEPAGKAVRQIDDIRSGGAAEDQDAGSALLFRETDGTVRAIRLALVERVEDVETSRLAKVAGSVRVVQDGQSRIVHGLAEVPSCDKIKMLHLSDGLTHVHYVIDEIEDIVRLPARIEPVSATGLIAGIVLIEGVQVELIDGHWLFAQIGEGAAPTVQTSMPKCWLGEDNGWNRAILAPLVQAAGYEPVFGTVEDGTLPQGADVYILSDGDTDIGGLPGRIIRLRSQASPAEQEDGSIYRYDRAGLVGALQSAVRLKA